MRRAWLSLIAAALVAAAAWGQQTSGAIRGRVADSSGAVIPGAEVSLAGPGGVERTITTDATGSYVFSGLQPGTYTVRATTAGFTPSEVKVEVGTAPTKTANFSLQVALAKQEVTVASETGPAVSTEAANNAGALVLRGQDLDALSDDPDDLASDLQALAGPAAGPNGGEIYVDGFSNAQLPPKASIREVRINQNPFSAEYDRLGFGRIEILTKPGTDRFRGQAFFDAGDAIFNSRNPYAPNQPDFQSRRFGGNLSGPLGKRASFFMDFQRREIDDNALINATTVDPVTFVETPVRDAVVTPQRRTDVRPRIDYQLSPSHTLVARYSYERTNRDNAGVGGYSLLSQAYNSLDTEHDIQITETAVLSPRAVNETRFHFEREASNETGNNTLPTIRVLDSFTTGGVAAGLSSQSDRFWEVQNFTTAALGAHGLKFGLRLRVMTLDSVSPQNFGGTFLFDSLQLYQLTLQLQQQGLTPEQIRAQGGGPTQFSIAGGTPGAGVSRVDVAPYIQDDWRVHPNFTLSLGLRYETQTNIHDWRDIAPRLGFAWAPGRNAKGNGKTVVRGGFGMFYDRVSESLTLQAARFNGINQQQYIVTNPDFFPNVPPLSALAAAQLPETTWKVASNLRAPYTMQAAAGIERQLPRNTTVASTFTYSRGDHLLRARAINAPLPGSSVGPYGSGNIFQYESSGSYRQVQWITNVNSRLSKNVSFFAFYMLGKAMSDTDGAGTFPANSYNLSTEWGRASMDVRHRFMIGGAIATRWGVRLSPFVIVNSGAPFNITTGTDLNGDTLFTDRPALAADPTAPGVIVTQFGAFDPNPAPGQAIIPRNFGQGPGFFMVNLRLSKTFGFGEPRSAASASGPGGGGGGHRHGPPGGGMRMGGGGFHSIFGDALTDRRYNLTFTASARNLLNHTNRGPVVGNLSSPFFGQSLNIAGGWGPAASAGNRRVELGLRFSF
jgi:hypothetical protein